MSRQLLLPSFCAWALAFACGINWCRGENIQAIEVKRGEDLLHKPVPVYRVTGTGLSALADNPAELANFKLVQLKTKSAYANTDDDGYLIFFKAKNTDHVSADFIFHLVVPRMDTIRYNDYRNGQLINRYLTGDKFPISSRPMPTGSYHFAIHLEEGEERQVFIHLKNQSNRIHISYEILAGKSMLTRQASRNTVMFSCTGLILATCLLNFFLFLHFRDWLYIKYILYVSLVVFSILLEEGFIFELFLGAHPLLNEMLYYNASLFSIGFSMMFVRDFVASGRNTAVERALKYSAWLPFAAGLYCMVSCAVFGHTAYESVLVNLLYGLMGSASVLMFIFLFMELHAGNFRAKVYIFSISGLTVAVAVFALYNIGYFGNYFMRNNILMLGLSFEAVVLNLYMVNLYRNVALNESKLQLQIETHQKENLIKLVDAQESERQRIAGDLHDGVAGYLGALRLFINSRILHFSKRPDQSEAAQSFETIQEKIDVALSDIRSISHNLMPRDFDTTRLSVIIDNYFSMLNSDSGNVSFTFIGDDTIDRLPKTHQINIYRVIVELTSNIIRHAEASEATVQCLDYDNYILLQIEDNGKGFNIEQQGGIGLKNIRSRVDFMKGEMSIDSGRLSTTIIIEIPVTKE